LTAFSSGAILSEQNDGVRKGLVIAREETD
jgi:hypothetical protein